jgi:hypothetical protein
MQASQNQTETGCKFAGVRMSRFVRSDSVVSRVIAGETLIVPIRRGVGDLASIYSLNSVATAIWQALSEPHSADEVIGLVSDEFEEEIGKIAEDVRSFLAEMQSAGLVNDAGAVAA